MIHDTQSAQISQKQDGRNIYAIMKTMCPPGYHHNGFVATHALEQMMYGYTYGGLSTVCHSCRFACQQRVLKTFPGPGYLRSENGLV